MLVDLLLILICRVVEPRGIEPRTSAVRLLPTLHLSLVHESKVRRYANRSLTIGMVCDTSAIPTTRVWPRSKGRYTFMRLRRPTTENIEISALIGATACSIGSVLAGLANPLYAAPLGVGAAIFPFIQFKASQKTNNLNKERLSQLGDTITSMGSSRLLADEQADILVAILKNVQRTGIGYEHQITIRVFSVDTIEAKNYAMSFLAALRAGGVNTFPMPDGTWPNEITQYGAQSPDVGVFYSLKTMPHWTREFSEAKIGSTSRAYEALCSALNACGIPFVCGRDDRSDNEVRLMIYIKDP